MRCFSLLDPIRPANPGHFRYHISTGEDARYMKIDFLGCIMYIQYMRWGVISNIKKCEDNQELNLSSVFLLVEVFSKWLKQKVLIYVKPPRTFQRYGGGSPLSEQSELCSDLLFKCLRTTVCLYRVHSCQFNAHLCFSPWTRWSVETRAPYVFGFVFRFHNRNSRRPCCLKLTDWWLTRGNVHLCETNVARKPVQNI